MYFYEDALFLDLAAFHQQVDPPSPLPPYRYPRHPQIMYFYKEALFLDLAAFHQQGAPVGELLWGPGALSNECTSGFPLFLHARTHDTLWGLFVPYRLFFFWGESCESCFRIFGILLTLFFLHSIFLSFSMLSFLTAESNV
jgi:hypothetical protein